MFAARKCAASSSAELTYLTSLANSGSLTVYTFSGVSLGDPHSTRMIAVVLYLPEKEAFTSVTIAGVTATVAANALVGTTRIVIASARVPSGATGDIVVTWGTASDAGMGISVFRGINVESLTATAVEASDASPGSISIDVSAGGILLACAANSRINAGDITLSGVTTTSDQFVAGGANYRWVTGTHHGGATARAVEATYVGTTSGLLLVGVSWR